MTLELRNFKDWATQHPELMKEHVSALARPVEQTNPFEPPAAAEGKQEPAEQVCPINEWGVEEWRKVPGVGTTLAMRLVGQGPYQSLEGIRQVKGISERIVNEVRQLLA
jgi:DNA uptake protein ComE-like DNA-binding protein